MPEQRYRFAAHYATDLRGSALDLVHADISAILDALGLGTHARPHSMHTIVRTEILPAIQVLREGCDACGAEPGEQCRFGCLGYHLEHYHEDRD